MPVTRILDHLMKVDSTNSAQTGLSVLNEQKYEKHCLDVLDGFGAKCRCIIYFNKTKAKRADYKIKVMLY